MSAILPNPVLKYAVELIWNDMQKYKSALIAIDNKIIHGKGNAANLNEIVKTALGDLYSETEESNE